MGLPHSYLTVMFNSCVLVVYVMLFALAWLRSEYLVSQDGDGLSVVLRTCLFGVQITSDILPRITAQDWPPSVVHNYAGAVLRSAYDQRRLLRLQRTSAVLDVVSRVSTLLDSQSPFGWKETPAQPADECARGAAGSTHGSPGEE